MIKKSKVKDSVNILREIVKQYHEDPKRKKNLLEDETEASLYLQITLKKIPDRKNIKMIKVPLPNSVLKDNGGACLITGDVDKRNHKAEVDPDILHYEELLKSHGITCISEVITLRQLRTDYKPYEAKQLLLGAYDTFLADKKIVGVLPRVLGRHFFKKRKYPIQIDFTRKDLKKEIEKALSAKVLFLTGHGNNCTLEVANLDMDDSKIIENVMEAVNTLSEKLPGSWDNVMGVYFKTSLSKAIPLYMSYDGANDIKFDVKKEMDIVEDDLSSVPNASVRVYSDGRVECKRTVQSGEPDECEDGDISGTEGEEIQNSGEKRKRSGKPKKNLLLPECDQIKENKTSENSQVKGAKKLKKSKTQNILTKQTMPLSDDFVEDSEIVTSVEHKKIKKSKKQTANMKQAELISNGNEESQAVKSSEETKKITRSKKQVTNEKVIEILPLDFKESQAVKSSEETKKIKKSKKQVTNEKLTEILPLDFKDSQIVTSVENKKIKKSKKETANTKQAELISNGNEDDSKPVNSDSKKMKRTKKGTNEMELKSSNVAEDELCNQNKKPNKRKRVESESALPKLHTENRNKFESPVQVLKKKRLEGNLKKHLAMKEARKNKKKENRLTSK